jgi:short-chain fatty acids transporter
MNLTDKYSRLFKYLLPTPFTIAILLTIFTFLLALLFSKPAEATLINYGFDILSYWEQGIWDKGLMVFALQMMLMLVLGHVLALSPPFSRLIDALCNLASNTAKAAALVALSTLLVAYINWGLGLIFGAILSRKMGEAFARRQKPLNYALVGAAGYCGLMVWHGGLSGSSLVKIAEPGHLHSLMQGIFSEPQLAELPQAIPLSATVFSHMNILAALLLLILLPLYFYWMGKNSRLVQFPQLEASRQVVEKFKLEGAEKLDHQRWLPLLIGLVFLCFFVYKISLEPNPWQLNWLTPDFINFALFGLGILLHGSFHRFLNAIQEAIEGAAGILIQFPLYFGIMGMIKYSGLINQISDFFISISSPESFPIFTLISAGIVNVFVPSGGGQWAIQGPIIIQAANELGIRLEKCILALAYGDQLTNMLQPFWALPLLGITRLKAKEILPYTLQIMLIGAVVFVSILLVF